MEIRKVSHSKKSVSHLFNKLILNQGGINHDQLGPRKTDDWAENLIALAKGPGFSFQNLLGGPQPSIFLVPRNLRTPFNLYRHQAHARNTNMHLGKI